MKLRRFNDIGLEWFRSELAQLQAGSAVSPDLARLEDPAITEVISPFVMIEKRTFSNKRDAAKYLTERLASLNWRTISDDIGLWAWLTLFYFDEVCPIRANKRRVLQASHYIPDSDFRRRYRHLLATPVRVLREIPQNNSLFLEAPLSQHGEIMEQLMSRLYILRVPGVAEALEMLYYDSVSKKPKRGIVPKQEQAGDLRNRFMARLRQLLLTYDVSAMRGPELVKLLGPEFDRWRR